VKDHPRAKRSGKDEKTLWTLITNKREIPVMGSRGILRFLDWDEIPDSKEAEEAWEKVAGEMLNGPNYKACSPCSAPCLDRKIMVWINQGGWRPLDEVKVGDWIYGNGKWTKVKGKSERIVSTGIDLHGTRVSDGNWFSDGKGSWIHPSGKSEDIAWQGIQLITDSDCFTIKILNGKEYLVRDFTEVGSNQILESHTRVEALLEEER
jgi:hypothetical protein